jgi:hypothetical protein
MTAAFLTVASMLFNGYANGGSKHPIHPADTDLFLPVEKSSGVKLIVGDAAGIQPAERQKHTR